MNMLLTDISKSNSVTTTREASKDEDNFGVDLSFDEVLIANYSKGMFLRTEIEYSQAWLDKFIFYPHYKINKIKF
jgi:hypothetical protein